MQQYASYKILLVDDELALLEMLTSILKKAGYQHIITATSYQDAVEKFNFSQPDCAILDVTLPDGDGFTLLKEIRKTATIPVLFLSARDEDENRLIGLGLGADDYIVKPFLPEELTLRLLAILKRSYPDPKILQPQHKFSLGKTKIDLDNALVKKGTEEVMLTAKERALLQKLYTNKNNIVTGDALCQAIWGDDLYGYENTLMVHVRRLREKIEDTPSKPMYLLTVRGLGYKLVGVEEI